MKPPSERELQRVERELKQLNPGAQKAVGGGIYMRLDGSGRRRFQFRLRSNGSSQPGGTYDSWQEAADARTLREAASAAPEEGVAGPSANAVRDWEISSYVEKAWWPDVVLHLDVLTQDDYDRGWQDLKPHVRGVSLADLESAPLLIDKIKRAIAKAKTYSSRQGEAPKLHPAAADKPLKVLSIISSHALDRPEQGLPEPEDLNFLPTEAWFNTRLGRTLQTLRCSLDGVAAGADARRKVLSARYTAGLPDVASIKAAALAKVLRPCLAVSDGQHEPASAQSVDSP